MFTSFPAIAAKSIPVQKNDTRTVYIYPQYYQYTPRSQTKNSKSRPSSPNKQRPLPLLSISDGSQVNETSTIRTQRAYNVGKSDLAKRKRRLMSILSKRAARNNNRKSKVRLRDNKRFKSELKGRKKEKVLAKSKSKMSRAEKKIKLETLRRQILKNVGEMDSLMCLPKAFCGISSQSSSKHSPFLRSDRPEDSELAGSILHDYVHLLQTVLP